MLCHRGCGQEATYLGKNGKHCCAKSASKCPIVKAKIGSANSVALTGFKYSEERRIAQSERVKKSWAEGKRGKEESRQKLRESLKKNHADHPRDPWNKGKTTGQIPWNKGMKKEEPPEILNRDDPAYSNFTKYRNRVQVRTKNNYRLHKHQINPTDLPLGKCGIEGAYQIDHIISVREGFERGISIEEISSVNNLRVIPWLENVKKYGGSSARAQNQNRHV